MNVVKTPSLIKSVYLLFGLLTLAGCGVGCSPSTCSTGQAAIEQLTPIAQSIQKDLNSGGSPPENLAVFANGILSEEVELRPATSTKTASYLLFLSNEEKPVGVTYTVTNDNPDLSFGYTSRWGLDTCFWDLKESDWVCFRRR
ncbi:hypothetical protein [Tateyamaria sp. SN3-11]|uniref:hypothetical protein n=1 Tax=Tateyamaria sp. SN3-11 TaxID=3092147 RepID=UPI0039E9C71C